MSWLQLMLREHELGNICHEHLEYYSMQSFEYLLRLEGFEIVDVEINAVNGGSLRAYIRRHDANPENFADGTYRQLAEGRGQSVRDEEGRLSLGHAVPYAGLAFWAGRIKR